MLVGFSGFVLSAILDIDARIALVLSSGAAVFAGLGFLRVDAILTKMQADKEQKK